MSIRRRVADKQHRWLSQVDLSGVVLSEPVLAEAAPAGFRNLEKRELAQFYKAREVWNLPRGMVQGDPDVQWVDFILEQLLRLDSKYWQTGATVDARYVATLSQQRETLRPTRVLLDGTLPVLLFVRVPRAQSLETPWSTGGSWKASPTTKVERLLRETGVEIGLVTNGEAWRLIVASPSETASWITWTAQTWADSPSTLAAFMDLLGEARFFAGPKTGTILELVRSSRKRQADVADQLGTQVQEALELFVREIDRVDAGADGALLKGYADDEVFEAAASLLMRLVFLLKAEESGLLPHGAVAYDRSYGVLYLLTRLEREHRLAPEKLQHSTEAYAQLLGTFRLVHDGSPDPDINVATYGGDLFDADKYPLLEGRGHDGLSTDRRLTPLPIRDSVVRAMLRRLKYARGDNGAVQWVSYRMLEIEQLGHMYEGLLDLRLQRASADSSLMLLTPTDKVASPSINVAELLALSSSDQCAALAKATGRTPADVVASVERNAKRQQGRDDELPEGLPENLAPYVKLVRAAGVVRPCGLFVDFGNRRHDQGAVYTPTSITEPMVRRTLEPLVYVEDRVARRVRGAREILGLRVCDPAMGSAAFLVQAVRFLADRLVDAWDAGSASEPGVTLKMPYGTHADGDPGELLMPDSQEERVVWARRFVAERCVYGVDVNPLAVEMAKLSLWLTTAAADKPFTFLDHVLRCGNSVLGADIEQVRSWSIDRKGGEQPLLARLLEGTIKSAVETRHGLARLTGRATETERRRSLRKAETATARLGTSADLLVGAWLGDGDDRARENKASSSLLKVISARTDADWASLEREARNGLGDVQPFHWPCEFPDVFIEGHGFDAVIGNPPYVRQEILSPLKPFLKRSYAAFDGSADLYVYFYELGLRILRPGGRLSLIVTNKWMKAGYGEGLRRLLAQYSWLESVVDFGHAKQLFRGVDVFPSILVTIRPSEGSASAPSTTRICVVDRTQLRLDDLGTQIDTEGYDVARETLGQAAWTLEPPAVLALMRKMRDRGVPLEKKGVAAYRGILSGLNEAFFLSDTQRNAIVAAHGDAASLFVKLIRGRDLKRWHVQWGEQWLLLLKSSENHRWPWSERADAERVFQTTYPSVYDFMLPMRERLIRRADKGKHWWELRSCAYYDAFERPKITYQVIQYSPCYSLETSGFYGNDKIYFLTSGDPVLVAVLNSPLLWWYCWRFLGHMKDDALNPAAFKMSQLPIPDFGDVERRIIAERVDELRSIELGADARWNEIRHVLAGRWQGLASALTVGARRGGNGLKAVFRKTVSRELQPSKPELRELCAIADQISDAIGQSRVQARHIEVCLSDLVFDAFGLSEEERALVWETAPARMPLGGAPDEESPEQDQG